MAESLRDLVGQLVRSVRERTDTQSNAQSEALSHLHRSGPVSVSRLAESRGVTHQTMRLVVARLEASGLVERKSDPADGRGQLVELTAQGREAALDGQRKRAAWLAQAIRTTLSPAEQDALAEALSLLKRVIAASGTPPPT
ncbi:MarR family winged helix-turn-helix transcriptional regulator [Roseateles sp. YR242]|uniref:MarR family winged helix-turn-helix transcriptional regulator n=1 Tax=Roseateles sp. YR242 TaxID=1855305 RepID=UPI0015A596F6|nr:MarR family transcriptional regulator [Roseateles sp. YR242]